MKQNVLIKDKTILPHKAPERAIIYCRVSSKRQASDGAGLESQEHRCREHAADKGYIVDAVFPDDVSGGGDFINRPGMVALLAFLDAMKIQRPNENYVVIFDDLKRYARDTEFHLKLRRVMTARGARRECLNFDFDDSPEGKFIETIIAAQGELEREQNGRQTIQKMKARVEQGFWVFKAPEGYKYKKSKSGGRILVPDPVLGPIVKEALEGFASGHFASQVEVKRFLESKPDFPKTRKKGEVLNTRITRLLNQPIYAGYVSAPNWNISPRPGNHEALISKATYEKIQDRLNEKAHVTVRKDIHEDFPLRGFATCSDCDVPYRSGWSKGKNKKYAYYTCQTKGCASYGKSIGKERIEGEFEALLKTMRPTHQLVAMLRVMVERAWDMQAERMNALRTAFKSDLRAVEEQIDSFLERIIESSSMTATRAYERKINDLEKEKLLLEEKILNFGSKKIEKTFTKRDALEHSLKFLANPCKIWDSGNLALRKLVLKLAFFGPMRYHRDKGILNTKKSLPFSILDDINTGNFKVVRAPGLEPGRPRAEGF